MTSTSREKLRTIIAECTEALFAAQSTPITIRATPVDRDQLSLASSIGYTGADVRGSLSVTTTHSLVARSRPAEVKTKDHTELELADWIGELTNQLLGRVKNQLLRYGVSIFMSTPVVVVGRQLRQTSGSSLRLIEHAWENNGEVLLICFEIEGKLELQQESRPQSTPPIAEGDVELF